MPHSHHHAPAQFNRAFALGVALNTGFVALEAFYGWKVGSLSLLADAGHNLSDVAGLLLAWGGVWASQVAPNERHTYGWKRASILAAFANALLLLLAMGSLAWEAIGRFAQPSPVQGLTIMAVAALGILINGATALLFLRGKDHDLNIRAAFVHMMVDALVSAGVVGAGALALWKGWNWIDPVMSLLIVVLILAGTWNLLRQSVHLLFDGVPFTINPQSVRQYLETLPGVTQVSDLHIWAMGTSQIALTAHLVMPAGHPDDEFLQLATKYLHDHFEIEHVTLQVMRDPFHRPCGTLPAGNPS